MDIISVAKLANLTLSPEESKALGSQMEKILEYISRLQSAAKSSIVPTNQTTNLQNVAREDVVGESLKLDHPEFIVPAVLSND